MKFHSRTMVAACALMAFVTTLPAQEGESGFSRGEVNQDGVLDFSDPLSVLLHLFQPGFVVPCEKAADFDDNGSLNITDASYGLNYLFKGGPAPGAPFGFCGLDPTEDGLSCDTPPCVSSGHPFIISEILASNADGLEDEDGDTSDWIEIQMLDSSLEQTLDLGGYFLTGVPELINRWEIPSGTELSRGEFLVVFASGKNRDISGDELHTDFRLSGEGEYLALVAPDGETIIDEFSPIYPQQIQDVSYGPTQSTTTLLGDGTAIKYLVPSAANSGDDWTDPDYDASSWRNGRYGVGFSSVSTDGFEVTYMKATGTVSSVAAAELVARDPARRSSFRQESAQVIDYFSSGGRGNFAGDAPFPGETIRDIDNFVVVVTGTILIPSPGFWSFGVNSDDGFELDISGAQDFTMAFPEPRGPSDTIQAFNFAQAGPYEIRLIYFEQGGGAHLEFFGAQGSHATFNGNFELVGDTANGGLGLVGFASSIDTDVESRMKDVNASIWTRAEFDIENPATVGGLVLRIKYEDGFVAYINGQEVARRNAPASPAWNSSAVSNRPLEDAALVEEISLTSFAGSLRAGTNVLAIQGLNDTDDEDDFLLAPELITTGRSSERQYMSTPSPGAFNVQGSVDFVRDVQFSVERGFFDAAFNLELSTDTDDATIRFTTDGSTPTTSHGTVYSSSRSISRTSVIRAIAYKEDHLDSNVTTKSYFFPSDIVTQYSSGQSPGAGWPSGSVNGQVLNYGMDPNVTNDARWRDQMEEAMLSIPSMSIVTDVGNLFNSSSGIYVNARNSGRAWERRSSLELLNPDGTPGFGTECGLRIRGAFSRSGDNPKHSFRVFFRSEYGNGRLNYPLFGGEGVNSFDRFDFRTSQNYSWAFGGDSQNTFIRDVFSRDAMRDMGDHYTRSRYYHLYLNGVYWGLYMTEERADSEYAQSYMGGNDADYDVIKNNSSGNRALQASDGTIASYRRLYDAAVAGFASNTAYFRVLGLRSDGSVNPNGEQLVDPQNLMDYMICTYYTGDPDAPISAWAHFSNNIFAIYNRERKDGYKWLRHDAEHSLGSSGGLNEGRILTDPTDRSIGSRWEHFNPSWLHLRLTANREYLTEFGDRVNMFFHNGGPFSSAENAQRWSDRANTIDLAVIGASARWGDSKREPPRTKADWDNQNNYMLGTYFPQRTQIVLNQMRSVNMFPDQAIVSFNQHGGHIDSGFVVLMTQSNGTTGTIYYTTDGSDPRNFGGSINGDAEEYEGVTGNLTLIARGANWRYWDQGTNPGATWNTLAFNDNAWDQGPAELGYGDDDEATEVGFGPDEDNKYITTYFRHEFNVDDASSILALTLGLVRDDGAAVYINGVEAIPRVNLPAGALTHTTPAQGAVPVGNEDESTFFESSVDPGLLQDGNNVIAVEIHQVSGDSSDISFNLDLVAVTAGDGGGDVISLTETTTVNARVYDNGDWGAMTTARFTVGLEGLVINEFMASNATTLEDPDEPGEFPDWIELFNGTGSPIHLGGMYLSDDPLNLTQWQIPDGVSIDAGEHLVFYVDDDGTQGPLHTNFQLSRSAETISIVDRDGVTVLDQIEYPAQAVDISYGRADDEWGYHEFATPGFPNSAHIE